MPWPQTGATHYHTQIGPSDKGRAIKGLVVCYAIWLGTMICWMSLWTSARCVVWSPIVGRMAMELKFRNTQKINTDTYKDHNSTELTIEIQSSNILYQRN